MGRVPGAVDGLMRALPLRLRARFAIRAIAVSYDAFNRQDIDTLFDLYAPDCVWRMANIEAWPESPEYLGHDGLREIFRDWYGQWEFLDVQPSRVVQSPGPSLITCEIRGRGKVSGVNVQQTWFQVANLRRGKIALVDNYSDEQEAVRAFERAA